jgi:hypothetical protein
MREHRRHLGQIESFDRLKVIPLERKSDGDAPGTDRLRPLRQNRAEAFARAAEHTSRRIEFVDEPGRRRRWWDGDQLADNRRRELVEIRLEIVVEVRVVRLFTGSVASLSTFSPCGPNRPVKSVARSFTGE